MVKAAGWRETKRCDCFTQVLGKNCWYLNCIMGMQC